MNKHFNNLKKREQKPLLSEKKTILNFRFEGEPPEAIKFVGHWYKKSSLLKRISQFGNKPWFVCEKTDRTKAFGMLISNPFLNIHDTCYLLLTCEGITTLDKERYSTLTFLGGFDHRGIALNHNMDTKFLTLAYPATESYQDLINHIKSEAELGRKFYKDKDTHAPDNYKIYYNELLIPDNTVFFTMGDTKITYVTYNLLNVLTTSNIDFCNQTDDHLNNMIKKSTLVSKVSEKERNKLFNIMMGRIEKLKEKIDSSVESY